MPTQGAFRGRTACALLRPTRRDLEFAVLMWAPAQTMDQQRCSSATRTCHDRWRNFGRKLDYWAIALSSTALLRAVTRVPAPLTCAAVALTPFQPFAVTACNGAAVEVGHRTEPVGGAPVLASVDLAQVCEDTSASLCSSSCHVELLVRNSCPPT